MFRSRANPFTQCKKHLKHKQSPGVCSVCLTEKLSKLSSSGGGGGVVASSSASSSCASSLSSSSDVSSCESSCLSPSSYGHGYNPRRRRVAFEMRDRVEKKAKEKGKEKGKFWSKLLTGTRRTRRNECQGQVLVSHSEPLPITSSKILAN